MITAQVENWNDLKDEVVPLLIKHYDEVGQNKEKMKLAYDVDKFNRLSLLGIFHIVTVRQNGKLVGYHAGIIDTLMHYKDILANDGDAYWIDPSCRGAGGAVLKLFSEVERSSKSRGVKVLYDITKLYADHDKLFQHLGYKAIERRYSKWIGE